MDDGDGARSLEEVMAIFGLMECVPKNLSNNLKDRYTIQNTGGERQRRWRTYKTDSENTDDLNIINPIHRTDHPGGERYPPPPDANSSFGRMRKFQNNEDDTNANLASRLVVNTASLSPTLNKKQ